MPRPPDRSVPAYDRWVRTKEVPPPTPEDQVGPRLQTGRRLGQRALARLVARTLRAPDHGLLHALNTAAQFHPASDRAFPIPHLRALDKEDPTKLPTPETLGHGQVRGWLVLEGLACTLIHEQGQRTAVAEAAWRDGLRALATDDHEARAMMGLALALWAQPTEWRRRLRACENPACTAPYFIARAANRRGRYCKKAHEQTARRWRAKGLPTATKIVKALPPGQRAPRHRPDTGASRPRVTGRLAAAPISERHLSTGTAFTHPLEFGGPVCVTPVGVSPCICGIYRLDWRRPVPPSP